MNENITIDIQSLSKHGININEYLTLFDVANSNNISMIFNYGLSEIESLEKKGLIKISEGRIHLRGNAFELFNKNDDLFEDWLKIYPINVKKKHGGSRALSPASVDTILGKKLKAKWAITFKKDTEKQYQAIAVLRAYIRDLEKSGDLEYAVEAHRWLNEGFHEKYAYLVKEDEEIDIYKNEDYI